MNPAGDQPRVYSRFYSNNSRTANFPSTSRTKMGRINILAATRCLHSAGLPTHLPRGSGRVFSAHHRTGIRTSRHSCRNLSCSSPRERGSGGHRGHRGHREGGVGGGEGRRAEGGELGGASDMRRRLMARVERYVQERKLITLCWGFETRIRGLYIHLSRGVCTCLVLTVSVFLDFQMDS